MDRLGVDQAASTGLFVSQRGATKTDSRHERSRAEKAAPSIIS